MRVATYTQRSAPSRGSVFALCVLVMTILLGTGVVPSLAAFAGGPFERVLTPLWMLLYLSALGGLMFTQGINWISWLVRYRILLVILMLGTILSVSWSIDARVSAERTVHLLGSTLIAVFIGFSVPLLTTLRVFAVILALAIVGSVGAAVALPDLGIQSYEGTQVWRGLFNSKNDLGFWAAVGVLLYITLSDSTQAAYRKLLCFLMAGLCLGVLAFSQSATSLLALLIAGALSLYFFIAGRFQLGFIRMAILAILFTGVIGMAIANIDTAELVGRTGDLTGRGEVWKQVWALILERPLTGVGYGSLWFPTDDTIWIQQSLTDFTWVVFHAHNGLLQVASEVGMPLAVIALLMVAQQMIEIFYCQYERQQVGVLFVLGFVTAYLVSNYSEARFLVTRELFWIFFLALPISMLRQINLVSLDAQPMEPDDVGARPYGNVPGKPWLGPLPQERVRARRSLAAGAAGGAALMTHYGASHSSDSVVSSNSDDVDEFAGTEEFDGSQVDTLSLDETDIDLGQLDDEELHAAASMSADIDLGEVQEEESQGAASVDADRDEPFDGFATDHDDMLDIDRYDKKFDLSGEWQDYDPDDDKR
ncbi:O-antigen ligase family protein [Granulosicoccus sp. 3-233]|uniref:O-antigen ligase family protein n=1 Tax=Granulosicoccus sp. 3-233 TaxID=3417969 RepID=UPI003D331FB7